MRSQALLVIVLAIGASSCTQREQQEPVAPRVEIPSSTASTPDDGSGVTARYNAAKAKRLSEMKAAGKTLTSEEEAFLAQHPVPDKEGEGKAKEAKEKANGS